MDKDLEELVGSWLVLPDVAARLGILDRAVRTMVRERRLVALRRPDDQVLVVPEAFFVPDPDAPGNDHLLPSLRGSLTQLRDSGYADAEAVKWLFTPDEAIGDTPIGALRAGRVTTVRRAAQSLAF